MADDREAKFLDALYFGAKDGGIFDRAKALLADQFDCASATVVDFDAVTPAISLACAVGFDPEFLRLYQEQFAAIDPAPPAFANACPSGKASSTLIVTYHDANGTNSGDFLVLGYSLAQFTLDDFI